MRSLDLNTKSTNSNFGTQANQKQQKETTAHASMQSLPANDMKRSEKLPESSLKFTHTSEQKSRAT